MDIERVVIDNFRNIEHQEYVLGHRNIFTGPNKRGKTNTLLAIYWLLTGYQLDGSNDDASNKPNMSAADSKKIVSVLLEFKDESTIKKTYVENWVKKRGTKEVVLEGNVTQYFINDDKTGVSEANEWIRKKVVGSKRLETSKFDLMKAILDPYYMGEKCEWRTLRGFIIELVGDVSNDDVYGSDPILLDIKELLTKYEHDTSKTMKHLKGHIVKTKEEIDSKEKGILSLEEIMDIEKEELFNAEAMIESLDNNIANYNQQLLTSVNPNIQKLENEKAELNVQLSNQLNLDMKKLEELNFDIKQVISKSEKVIEGLNAQKKAILLEIQSKEQEKRNFQFDLSTSRNSLVQKEVQLEQCRQEYKEFASEVYHPFPLPAIDSCPHCGGALNEDYVNSVIKQNEDNEKVFDDHKMKKLTANIVVGKNLNSEIENLRLMIKEKEALESNFNVEHLNMNTKSIEQSIQVEEVAIHSAKEKLVSEYTSDETNELRKQISIIKWKINEQNSFNTETKIQGELKACKERKIPFANILSEHNLYMSSQNKIMEIKHAIDLLSDTLCGYENQLVLVEKFMQTKLSMLRGNVEKIFGIDVNFTLVETNIKEGSWNEVCYPSILHKNTPFTKGSGSEKIITGIYLIECVKKAMSLLDVPILFDECDKLDSESLSTRLNTNSQIITTKVDDINYKDVTLFIA